MAFCSLKDRISLLMRSVFGKEASMHFKLGSIIAFIFILIFLGMLPREPTDKSVSCQITGLPKTEMDMTSDSGDTGTVKKPDKDLFIPSKTDISGINFQKRVSQSPKMAGSVHRIIHDPNMKASFIELRPKKAYYLVVPYDEKPLKFVEISLDKKELLAVSDKKSITNTIGMKFVYVPPGTFMMGSPSNEPGRSRDEVQHQVTFTKGFYLQTTEVTQNQWMVVMKKNPSFFKDCGKDCPVEQVSWNDIQEFIKKLNSMGENSKYRLPTESEWEYACRAGSTAKFYFGNDNNKLREYGWYKSNSENHSQPVAQNKPNLWGLYDMHGNVREWCESFYGQYPSQPVTDPVCPTSGKGRIDRGGSWRYFPRHLRCAFRVINAQDIQRNDLGFRLVRISRLE